MNAVDPGSVARWRADQLARAGVPPRLAERLAYDRRIDVHALIELIERGCPPETACRILWPLDGSEAPG
jgi:hypothetical protein